MRLVLHLYPSERRTVVSIILLRNAQARRPQSGFAPDPADTSAGHPIDYGRDAPQHPSAKRVTEVVWQ
jgi:hypothetical protein